MQIPENSARGKLATEERILAAATILFGRLGYHGASTRDIASAAEVNEVTIYRHYPRKRDLYVAVLTAQLRRVSLRGDLLAELAHAADARGALAYTFELISIAIMREPELLRLVLYSSLELGEEVEVLVRKHLGELVEVVAGYLEPWVKQGELRCSSAKGLTLALISIVACHRPLHHTFSDTAGQESAFEAFAGVCLKTPWQQQSYLSPSAPQLGE